MKITPSASNHHQSGHYHSKSCCSSYSTLFYSSHFLICSFSVSLSGSHEHSYSTSHTFITPHYTFTPHNNIGKLKCLNLHRIISYTQSFIVTIATLCISLTLSFIMLCQFVKLFVKALT